MRVQKPDSRILGHILHLQSALRTQLEPVSLAELLIAGIRKVPGVADAVCCYSASLVPSHQGTDPEFPPDACRQSFAQRASASGCVLPCACASSGWSRIALEGSCRSFGGILLKIADPDAFSLYQPYIQNTINLAALVLENRMQEEALRLLSQAFEQKIAERTAALQESEHRWQFALEGAGDGIWDWNVSTNKVFFSRQWKAMLGYEEHEVGDGLDEWDKRIHPDDRDYAYAEIEKHFSGKMPAYASEHRLLCKDGTYKWILDRGKIVAWDEQGKPLRVIGTHADITLRKQAELDLRREKAFIDAVFDSIPGMLYVYDDQGVIVRWNKKHEEMTGYSTEELSRMRLLDWFRGDDETIALITERVQKAFREGFADAEANLQLKDGTKNPMYFTAVPVTIAGRSYFTGIGIDISERRKAEKEKETLAVQLLQAQKMESVGRLAGGMAHDFNNMLSVMFIAVDLMKMKLAEDDPLRHHLSQIERAAVRSRDVAQQLLAFSRKQIIAPKLVSLNDVVAETEKTIIRLIGEDIEVRFFPGDERAKILFDPAQIDQVLINLALNARDAMPDGGKLTIETASVEFDEAYSRKYAGFKPGCYMRLSVSDEGHGMDRETLDNIFEPFFTTKEAGKGTGLGLAMVYGVMKQNSGFVNVYSEVGQGTTFALYFPHAEQHEPMSADAEPSVLLQGAEKILLVEDNAMVRHATKAMLEELGYEVTDVATPADALDLVQKSNERYALLLTDIVMPGMNGRLLSERLRTLLPALKVLYMSGYTENAIVHGGVLDAGLHFIQKPFSIQDIARTIHEILND